MNIIKILDFCKFLVYFCLQVIIPRFLLSAVFSLVVFSIIRGLSSSLVISEASLGEFAFIQE